MNEPSSDQSQQIREFLQTRRERLQTSAGRPLQKPAGTESPLSPEGMSYLLGEARDLYWNDLEWENVTEEERMEGGPIPELTFPGVLAFVRGLLLRESEVPADALAPANPRPEVVERFLEFLAGRLLELEGAVRSPGSDEADGAALEYRMTAGLLDRVLMEFHGISPEDGGSLEEA